MFNLSLSIDELKKIASGIEKYAHIVNAPSTKNTIKIRNNKVELIVDGEVKARKAISTEEMDMSGIEYSKNVFNSSDVNFSPFEADREKNWVYWKNSYRNIDFPKLVPLPLMCWLIVGKWPDVVDLCKLYALTYTELVPDSDICVNKENLFTKDEYAELKNIGDEIQYTDGRIVRNKLIRFKQKYEVFLKDLPCNEFTTEQLFSRIYKAYGSCVRDPYMIIRSVELGASAEYDSYLDIVGGIDGIIEGIAYYGYIETDASKAFRKVKLDSRHKNLPQDKGIALEKSNEKRSGVYLIKDEDIKQILQDLKNDKIKGMQTYTY